MRYEIDENNYIAAVYFNCNSGSCNEYTGNIPDGYTSLEEWASNANILAYKIVEGNLVYDSIRDAELQEQWAREEENSGTSLKIPKLTKTVIGENLQISDSTESYARIKVNGKSTQNGTPTPEAPIEIQSVGDEGTVEIKQSGENIISSTSVSGGYNDIAPTITNGVINVKGTNNTDYNNKETYRNGFVAIKTVDRWEDKATYYFSCKVEVVSNQKNLDTSYFSCYLYGQAGFKIHYNSKTGRYEGKGSAGSGTSEKPKSVEFRLDGCELNISEIMLTTEETYEYKPHIQNNYVIPLSQPLRSLPNGVKDTIEEDGIHRRVGSVVLDGSEKWSFISGGNSYMYIEKNTLVLPQKASGVGMCSHFIYSNSNRNVGYFTLGNSYAFLIYTDYTDVAEWKAWLQENPIQVDYELAEEVIEPFDEEQQVTYNNLQRIRMTKETTYIQSNSGAILEVVYYVNNELNNTFAKKEELPTEYSYYIVTTENTSIIPITYRKYSSGDIVDVYINGLRLIKGLHFSISENNIVLTNEIDVVGTEIEIVIKKI